MLRRPNRDAVSTFGSTKMKHTHLIYLGVSPSDASCRVIPKEVLMKYVIGHIPQHRGKAGTDTFWFTIRPGEPQEWLSLYGGSLEKTLTVLKSIRKKKRIKAVAIGRQRKCNRPVNRSQKRAVKLLGEVEIMSDEEEIKNEKTDIEKLEENIDDITLTFDSMHKDLSKNTTIIGQEYKRVVKLRPV